MSERNDRIAKLTTIILAAGKGSRMKSDKLKVFHEIGGKPMIHYILETVKQIAPQSTFVVVGSGSHPAWNNQGAFPVAFVEQKDQLGTAHAVMQVEPHLREKDLEGTVLVLNGDVPLITAETIVDLMGTHVESNAVATVLTAVVEDPTGYGRIIRGAHGTITRIVEQKDGTQEELRIREINTGIYCFQARDLFLALKEIRPTNVQGEYYLTDTIAILKSHRYPVLACRADDSTEVIGVNSRQDLAIAEKVLQRRTVKRLMKEGVTVVDPESTFIDPIVQIGQDTVVYPFSFLQGKTEVGKGCMLGPHAMVRDSKIADGVTVRHADIFASEIGKEANILHAVVEGAQIPAQGTVGPFQKVGGEHA